MIDKKLLLKNVPRYLGEQIHVNHEGCSAGIDSKRRLYIKKTEKGLVAYCHHCSEKGFLPRSDITGDTPYHWKVRGMRYRATKSMPSMCALSIQGKAWLSKYNCSWDEEYFKGIVGDSEKVSLNIRNPLGDTVGYQVRNLIPDSIPKYTTHINDTVKGHTAWFHDIGNKILVITEDYLSSYRCHRDVPNISAMALLKTNLSDHALQQINDLEFEKIYIWLDPDFAGAKGRKNVLRKLSFYLPRKTKCVMLVVDKEPKECSKEDLVSIFERY